MGWGRCSALQTLPSRPQMLKGAIPHRRCLQHDPFPSECAPFRCPRLPSAGTKDARCSVSPNMRKKRGEIGVGRVFIPMGWGYTALVWAAEMPGDIPPRGSTLPPPGVNPPSCPQGRPRFPFPVQGGGSSWLPPELPPIFPRWETPVAVSPPRSRAGPSLPRRRDPR